MIRNYLLVAIRNFQKQKLYSAINVAGLSAGLLCVVFIYLWVSDELRMNNYNETTSSVYQVMTNIKNDGVITWETTPGVLAEELTKSIPEVKQVVRLMNNGDQLVQIDDKSFLEKGLFGDEQVFDMFGFPVTAGDQTHPVPNKNSIALSQALATRIFGNDDPIGKTLRIQKSYDVTVTSVFADLPQHSSIQFQFILPYEIYKEQRADGYNWGNFDHPTYITFHPEANVAEASQKINEHLDKLNLSEDGRDWVDFYLQPFSERYLNATFENGAPAGGRIQYVQIFLIVAGFILLIACINFMNMATAKASSRAKEVGVRKVIGAERKNLIFQFIAESMLISLVAMTLAVAAAYTLLPLFNVLVSKNIASVELINAQFLMYSLVIVMITGLLAGSYPAFFLSAYNPASVLKGTLYSAFSGAALRKTLVVFQFTLTVVLVASALVIYKQVNFIQHKNLGYNRESIVQFSARGAVAQNFNAFRNEVLKNPAIKSVSKSNQSLVEVQNQTSSVTWPGKPDDAIIYFRAVVMDFGTLETLEFALKDGRFFSTESDTGAFIITEKTVATMGLKNPVGTRISLWGNEGTVVGVVNDFHSRSLTEQIDPIVFYCQPNWTNQVYAKVQGSNEEALQTLAAVYKKFSPEYPFEYKFMDESFDKLYASERTTGKLAFGFTLLAIVISGLGLLGLAAYTAERRKKEISIRKVLGASVGSLISMMSRDFAFLSIIATVIGCPVAYYLMGQFLQRYQYHTELSWEVFAITAVSVLTLSLVTVIGQVTRAALSNPVNSLRSE
jgi:putative ABC transport system permease protein